MNSRFSASRGREGGWAKRTLALAIGLVMAVGATVAATSAASAAPVVTYPGAISNITLEKSSGTSGPLNQWDAVKINGDWAVPNGAKAGETFGMTLPQEFVRFAAGDFSIVDPDTNQVMATCTVTEGPGPDLVCTLTDAVNGKEDIGGSFWMQAIAAKSTTNETVEFDLGHDVTIVDLPDTGGIIPEDLTEPDVSKIAAPTGTTGRIEWVVGIPSKAVGNGSFVVKDQLDSTLENHAYTREIFLQQRQVVNGKFVGEWTDVDASKYQVNFAADNQSFDFTASGLPAGGYGYRLHYFTQAPGVVLKGDVFGNKATVNTTETKNTYTATESGGGNGSGDEYTRFTVTKKLEGDKANAAADAKFSVRYSVKGSSDAPKTMTFPVGQATRSDRAPLGSTFIIEEVDLPAIEGVNWGKWALTGDGVKPGADGTFEVTPGTAAGVELVLTNQANDLPVSGSVSWSKTDPDGKRLAGSEWELVGPGGALVVVDNGTSDIDRAEGALAVDNLAPGNYRLTETKAPEGFVKTKEVLSFVIDQEHQKVELGAVVNSKPPVIPPTTKPATPAPKPHLATTGSGPGWELPAAGAGLLLLGSAAVAASRSRRIRETARR